MAAKHSSLPQALEKIGEQITCAICLEHFNNPKVLPCFHSFCLSCLDSLRIDDSHSLSCPCCLSTCPVPDGGPALLPPSYNINNLIDVYNLLSKVSDHQHTGTSCDNCDSTNADCYCKQCAMFFCQQCLHQHEKWKSFIDHQTISFDEVAITAYQLPQDKLEQPALCTAHNKPLDIFCEKCQELICHDCTVKKHKNDDYDLVCDTYPKHKDSIVKSAIQPLDQEFSRLTEAKEAMINTRKEISRQAQTTNEEIHHTFAQIKIRLDETEKKLTGDVNLVAKVKVSVLNQQLKKLDTALSHVAECRDHIHQCVKVGTPQQVLSTEPQMMSRAQSVINDVKDNSFQPLEQPDIELVKSDAIDQVHSNVGTIKYTLGLTSVNLSHCHIPLVDKESIVSISFSLPNGSLAPVPASFIECHLIPPDNSPPIQCTVKESSQSGQCNVVFTPLTRGLHQLHVHVNDGNIPGSPVSVPVSVPPEKRDTPIKTITGLKQPRAMVVIDDGQMIVSERDNITVLDSEGKKIGPFAHKGDEFKGPKGLAITPKGNILTSHNHCIQEFTMKGECVFFIGDSTPGYLHYPSGIAINKATGHAYVADCNNHRVQIFEPDPFTYYDKFGKKGSEKGKFHYPHDVTIDSQGFVYVTDCRNHRVQKFTSEGDFEDSFGTKGLNPDQLYYPSGITIDDNDLLYINNHHQYVTVFTTDGKFISSIRKHDMAPVTEEPSGCWFNGISFDDHGNLFVCYQLGNLFWKF